jgi:hypothetical protein
LVTNAACYVSPSQIDPKQQRALLIYARVLELAAVGGTNYAAVMATTLVSDAATLTCGMSQPQKVAAALNLAFVNAATAGASVPSTLTAKLAAIACLVNLDPALLDDIDLMLTCKLGAHATQ